MDDLPLVGDRFLRDGNNNGLLPDEESGVDLGRAGRSTFSSNGVRADRSGAQMILSMRGFGDAARATHVKESVIVSKLGSSIFVVNVNAKENGFRLKLTSSYSVPP